MLKYLILCLFTFCLPFFGEAAAINLHDNDFKSSTSSGVVLVDFYADWCGPCRAMAPTIDDLSNEYQGKVKIAKINIDKEKNTTASFNISSLPTIIVFKDGREIKRISGQSDKQTLNKLIQGALQER